MASSDQVKMQANHEILDWYRKQFQAQMKDLESDLSEEDIDSTQVIRTSDYLTETFQSLYEQIDLFIVEGISDNPVSFLDEKSKIKSSYERVIRRAQKLVKNLNKEAELEKRKTELDHLRAMEALRYSNENLRHDSSTNSSSLAVRLPPLPKLQLPSFNGNLSEYSSWMDTFRSLIDDQEISSITKFVYLRSCLKGPALEKISSLSVSEENYASALDILNENYGRSRMVVSKLVHTLVNLPQVKNSAKEIYGFYDDVVSIRRSLKGNGVDINHSNTRKFVLPILERKISGHIRESWEKHASVAGEEEINFDNFVKHISIAAKVAESKDEAKSSLNVKRSSNKTIVNQVVCKVCSKGSHPVWSCTVFKNKPIQERFNFVKISGICFNCLSADHLANKCQSKTTCLKCNNRHHTMLHFEEQHGINVSAPSFEPRSQNVAHASHRSCNSAILMTGRTEAFLGNKIRQVRVLFDEGSQVSFISTSLVKSLGSKGTASVLSISGVADMDSPSRTYFKHSISLKNLDGSYSQVEAFEISKISNYSSPLPRVSTSFHHLKGLQLADTMDLPGKIEVLIGADMMSHFLTEVAPKVGKPNEPYARHTRIGWLVAGNMKKVSSSSHIVASHVLVSTDIPDISKFWELEEVGLAKEKRRTKTEEEVEKIFKSKVRKNEDGYIEAPLPLASVQSELSTTKELAWKRYQNLEAKFRKNSNFETAYRNEMQSCIENKFVEKIENENVLSSMEGCYLPHHAVVKESSETTKVRIVFDGSMKALSGKSLNDMLLVGPKLQLDLLDILYRWSFRRIAVVADIAKMYNQIFVPERERNLLKFFWKEKKNGCVNVFRHTRQVFGTASAAHTCIAAVRWNAENFRELYPRAVDVINDDMYVDDLVTGFDTVKEAREIISQILKVNSSSHLELRKFCSNAPEVLEKLEEDRLSHQNRSLLLDATKTLGYIWDPQLDHISLYTSLPHSSKPSTKRSILSDSSRCFDPQGRFAPVFFVAKLIFQETWKLKISWDEPIPVDLENRWLFWKEGVRNLKKVSMPRCVYSCDEAVKSAQLCIFCDASMKGWGAVLYIRLVFLDGTITTSFLSARSKVKPIKEISIPRMELEAAVVASKMIAHFLPLTPIKINSVHAWTDSSVVWHWLQKEPANWNTFVANRVQVILDNSKSTIWHHIAGVDNPADMLSRGISSEEFVNSALWFNGPYWLKKSMDEWPESLIPETTDAAVEKERRKTSHQTTLEKDPDLVTRLLDRFSSLTLIKRSMAWIGRFARLFTKKAVSPKEELTLLEIEEALIYIIRHQQEEFLSEQFERLSSGNSLSSKDSLLSLNPFWDSANRLIRVGGRLKQITFLDEESRHPVLIPSNSKLAFLLIDFEHLRLLHAGPMTMLASLRSKFWILRGRQLVTSYFKKCVRCRLTVAKPSPQQMGNLPSSRANLEPAFSFTSIDFAGPILTYSKKQCKTPAKSYICLFSDLSTRAIHLELARSLSTEDFVVALRRFVARRGIPKEIWSDHGRNFVGCSKNLSNFMLKEKGYFQKWAAGRGISWKFIPPRTPNQGGAWESMVKLTKTILNRQLRLAHLSPEQLETVLIEIEAVINSRPLSPLSPDSKELALTPSMLITGFNVTSFPDGFVLSNFAPASRWRKVNSLLQKIRKRWVSEYLLDQQKRAKWKNPARNYEVGDVVAITDEVQGGPEWPLARVVEVKYGEDGLVRSLLVKAPNGKIYHRPSVKTSLILPSED